MAEKRNQFEIGATDDPYDRLNELVLKLLSEANNEHIYDLVQNIGKVVDNVKPSSLEERMIACTVVISSLISQRCDKCTEDELNAGAYRAYHCAMAEILLPPWQDQLWDAGLEIHQRRHPEARMEDEAENERIEMALLNGLIKNHNSHRKD